MRRGPLLLLIFVALGLFAAAAVSILHDGLSARAAPSALETAIARTARKMAAPSGAHNTKNPLPDSPELQRERILSRPNMTEQKLAGILARQMPDAEKRKRAHFLVDTSHGLDPVRARIRDILKEAVKMPQRRT